MVYFYLVSIGDLADSNRNRAFARWKMKICGCSSCRRNGEINPYEQFEIYLLQREESSKDNFKTILAAEFSAQELNELETEFIIPSVADKINQHVPFDAQSYWMKYGGSLRGFQELNEY